MVSALPTRARLVPWVLVAAVLVAVPGAFVATSVAKPALGAVAVAMVATVPSSTRLPRSLVLIVAAGAAVLLVAALAGPAPWAAIGGRWPRHEGVLVLAVYAGALWAGARAAGTPGRDTLVDAASAASVVLGLASLSDAAGHPWLGQVDANRSGALLGNATDQGLVGAVLLLVLVPEAVARRRPWQGAGGASALVVVVVAGSRAGWLAVLVGLVVLAVLRPGPLRRATAAVGGLLCLAVVLVPSARDRLTAGRTIEGRLLLWQETLRLVADHPVLGVGPSGFVDAIGAYHDRRWVTQVGTAAPPDSPHSWPLQALVSGGPLLLVLAVAAVVLVIRLGWRVARDGDLLAAGLLAATAGYGVALLTHFTTPGPTVLVAFCVGLLVAETRAEDTSGNLVLTRATSVAAGATALVLAVAALADRSTQQGVEAAAMGEVTRADDAFSTAARFRPWDPDVAMIAAQALAGPASTSDPAAVRSTLRWSRRSLDRAPDTYASRLAQAVATTAGGEPARSLPLLDALVEDFPTEPQARIQRAIARAVTGDVEGALRDARTAVRLDPDDDAAAELLRRISAGA